MLQFPLQSWMIGSAKGMAPFSLPQPQLMRYMVTLAQALVLISISIGNVLSFLRIVNGAPPREVRFTRLEDDESFGMPWEEVPAAPFHCSFGEAIREEDIDKKTAEEIVAFYLGATSPQRQAE